MTTKTDRALSFSVGETLVLNSPYVGVDADVQYRGTIGEEACVILNGLQMMVQKSWLRRRPSKAES